MARTFTFILLLELDTRLPSAQDLADLAELRGPFQTIDSVSVKSGMLVDRMQPGMPYNHVDISQLVVSAGAAASSSALAMVIVEWLRGRADRRVKLRLGDNEIELLRPDDATVAKLMRLFEHAIGTSDGDAPSAD